MGSGPHSRRKPIMLRISLFSAVAALAMLAAPLAASAGQKNSAPTTQTATSNSFALFGSANSLSLNNNAIDQSNFLAGKRVFQDNSAPTHQSATSNAVAIGGDASATSVNTNLIQQSNDAFGRKIHQTNSAPTTQSAVSTAVSVGGDASALSANSNGVSQSNGAVR